MSLRDDLSVPVKEAEIGELLAALNGFPEFAMVVRRLAFQRMPAPPVYIPGGDDALDTEDGREP